MTNIALGRTERVRRVGFDGFCRHRHRTRRLGAARQHLTKMQGQHVDDSTYIDSRKGKAQLKVVAEQGMPNQTFDTPRMYAQYESRVSNQSPSH
ncbi:hypothetical protein AB0I22_36235 [Streptomyces sp. NPDC050610]|uniref:hypothetical protein n=1 Tax=Streptomyces sp. NPDC050610 TaxID=3157097 RepID=UPI00343DB9E8